MPLSISTATPKKIVDMYFIDTATKPKKYYSETDIRNILLKGGMYVITKQYSVFNDYIIKTANEYGVNINSALSWLNRNPSYYKFIIDYIKNNINTDSPLENLPGKIGEGVGSVVSSVFTGLLKGLLPLLLIIGIIYLIIKNSKKEK